MQEKILNFDSLLRNVYLKTSGNPEAEKMIKKIEEKAKEEVFAVCKVLSYKTKFPPNPVRKNKKGVETKEEKEAFLQAMKQYEKEKKNVIFSTLESGSLLRQANVFPAWEVSRNI